MHIFLENFTKKTTISLHTIYLATSRSTEVCARAFGSMAFHWLSAVTRAVINKISSWEATTTHFLLGFIIFFQRFLQVRLQLLPNTGTIINWETSSHVKCPRRVGLDVQPPGKWVSSNLSSKKVSILFCTLLWIKFFLCTPILQHKLT